MSFKKTILLLIILVLIIIGGIFYFFPKNTVSPNLPLINESKVTNIENKQINDNTKPYFIKINYPFVSGLDDFNKKVKDIIDKEIEDFKTNSIANDTAVKETDPTNYENYPREYELDINYDKGQVDNDIISIVFNVYNFSGGAHGASYFIPLNYNLKLKQEIKLADLFINEPDYLKKVSNYCIKDLTTQLTESIETLDGTWLEDGAGPIESNFTNFLINKDNIVFYFQQYQIAYGAAGDFKVIMPR